MYTENDLERTRDERSDYERYSLDSSYYEDARFL